MSILIFSPELQIQIMKLPPVRDREHVSQAPRLHRLNSDPFAPSSQHHPRLLRISENTGTAQCSPLFPSLPQQSVLKPSCCFSFLSSSESAHGSCLHCQSHPGSRQLQLLPVTLQTPSLAPRFLPLTVQRELPLQSHPRHCRPHPGSPFGSPLR